MPIYDMKLCNIVGVMPSQRSHYGHGLVGRKGHILRTTLFDFKSEFFLQWTLRHCIGSSNVCSFGEPFISILYLLEKCDGTIVFT